MLHAPLTPSSRTNSSQARLNYKEEIDQLLLDYRYVKEELQNTKDGLSTKFDAAAARILELETVLSVAKLEAEERLKKTAEGSGMLMQEITALRSSVNNNETNNRPFAHHIANIERHLQEMFILQSNSSLLPQQTAEMFTTINQLNNTIKSLKAKSNSRLKKLQSAYDTLEMSDKALRFELCEASIKTEQLQDEVNLWRSQYDALLSQQQQLEPQIRLASAPPSPSCNASSNNNSKNTTQAMTIKSLQMQIRLLQEECHHLKTAPNINSQQDDAVDEVQQKQQSLPEDLEEIQHLREALTVLATEHQQTLQQQTHKHNETTQQNTHQIQSLQSELKIITEALHNEQRQHAKVRTQVEDLTALNKRFADANVKLEATFKLSTQDISQQLDIAQQQVVVLQATNERQTEEIAESKKLLDAKSIKLKSLLHRRNEHDRTMEDLRTEITRLLQVQKEQSTAKETEKSLLAQQVLQIQRLNQRNIGHMNITFRSYESRLSSFSDRIRTLQSLVSVLKIKVHEKSQTFISLQESINQLDVSLLQVNKQNEEKKKEIHRLKRVQESLQSDFQLSLIEQEQLLLQSKRINNDLQLQINDLKAEINKYKQEKATLNSEIETLRREKHVKDGQIITLECSLEELKEKLQHKTTKCDVYIEELRLSHDQIMNLTLQHDKLQVEVHNTNENLMTTKFQNDSLQTKIKSLEEIIQRNKIEKEENLCGIHEKDLEIVQIQTACDQDRRVMQTRFDHLHDEMMKLQDEVVDQQKEVGQVQDELRQSMLEIKSLKQERQEWMAKERQTASKHRSEQTLRMEEEHRKTQHFQLQLEQTQADFNQQNAALQLQLQSSQGEKIKLEKQLVDLQCQYSQLEEEMALVVNRFQEEMISLHSHIANINS